MDRNNSNTRPSSCLASVERAATSVWKRPRQFCIEYTIVPVGYRTYIKKMTLPRQNITGTMILRYSS